MSDNESEVIVERINGSVSDPNETLNEHLIKEKSTWRLTPLSLKIKDSYTELVLTIKHYKYGVSKVAIGAIQIWASCM